MMHEAKVAVVGLGAAGAAALWALARAGCDVMGIEQFDIAHDRGSSHGQTRMLRVAYAEGPQYVPLVRRAVALWRELEAQTGERLFHETGIFYAGEPASAFLQATAASAHAQNVPLDPVPPAATRNELTIPAHWTAFVEREGGFVESERALTAFVTDARANGAKIAEAKATRIEPHAKGVDIITTNGTIRAGRVVVAAGAWAGELLPALAPHLHIERRVLHWFEDKDGRHHTDAGFKPFIVDGDDGLEFYGFPALDGTGVKVAEHDMRNARLAPVKTPDELDRTVAVGEVARVSGLVRRYLPALGQPRASKVCMYPMTTDGHFIVGPMPKTPNVIAAAGLCGHGFKFAPALGEALAALAQGRPPPVDIAYLSPCRFA
jgi:sarcosine oxidase